MGLLLLQGFCILPMALSEHGLALPQFLQKKLVKEALGADWKLDAKGPVYLSLGGCIFIKNPSLVHRDHPGVSLSAQRLLVDLSWWRIFRKVQPVERIVIEAGQVAVNVEAVDPQPLLLDAVYLDAEVDAVQARVHFASACLVARQVQGVFRGDVPQKRVRMLAPQTLEPGRPKRLGDTFLQKLLLLKKACEDLPEGVQDVYGVAQNPQNASKTELYAILSGLNVGPVTAEGPIELRAMCGLGGGLRWTSPLSVVAHSKLQAAGHTAGSGKLTLPIEAFWPYATPEQKLACVLKDVTLAGTQWPWATAALVRTNSKTEVHFCGVDMHKEPVRGCFLQKNKETHITVHGETDFLPLVQAYLPEGSSVQVQEYLKFLGPRHWDVDVQLDSGFKPLRGGFRVVAQSPWAYDVALQYARIEGHWEGSFLKIPFFEVEGMKSLVSGSYEHDLSTHLFRFLFSGGIELMEITPWMGAFWPRLFRPLKARGASLPRGSLDIFGDWHDAEATTQLWGQVEGECLEYRGIRTDYARALLRLDPESVRLDEVFIKRPEGECTASVHWTLTAPYDMLVASDFSAQGHIFPSALSTWGKNDFLNLLKHIKFSSAPAFKVTGRYNAQQVGPYSLNAQIETHKPVAYKKVQLDYAQARIELEDNQVFMDVTQLGFANGSGQAQVSINVAEDTSTRYHLELDLKDMSDREALRSSFEGVLVAEGPVAPLERSSKLGSLSAHLVLDGDLREDPLLSASGFGSFDLKQMELEDVYFLGLLSHIMKVIPLPFGRAHLDTAYGNFSLAQGGQLYFNDLTIKGPAAEVRGQGGYSLARDELDIRLKFFLLGGVRAPFFSHVGRLLNPLSHMFEVFVTGSALDPRWRFRPKGR